MKSDEAKRLRDLEVESFAAKPSPRITFGQSRDFDELTAVSSAMGDRCV